MTFVLIAVMSFLLLVAVCWVNAFSFTANAWCQTICYFAFTYYVLWKSQLRQLPVLFAVSAIILGRVLPTMVLMFDDIRAVGANSIVDLFVICAIILAAICFHEKRSYAFLLSMTISVLLNTLAFNQWIQMLAEHNMKV